MRTREVILRAVLLFGLFAASVTRLPAVQHSVTAQSEFIFETAPFASAHASTIVETKDGLVAAWFGGTREGAPDVGIWLSRRVSDRWTPPVEVATGTQADTRYPCWNPVLFEVPGKGLMLFYKVGPSPQTWWGMVRTSLDRGRTWAGVRRLPDGILGPIKNKPVRLREGIIVAPSSTESPDTPSTWRVHFERSTDAGLTWTASFPQRSVDGNHIDAIQPSILVHPDGKLQAVGRTRSGRIFTTWSSDGGREWTPTALTPLPNPNSGIDAVTLRDGRHLIVYNHAVQGRSPLNVAVSRDGIAWEAALVLESEPGEYSYPAVIQSADGRVHITYTWKRQRIKHVAIDPATLQPVPMLDGNWPKVTAVSDAPPLGKAGVSGSAPDLFDQPTDVLVAPNGDIFVSDSHRNGKNNRIVRFTKDGTFIKRWGKKGSGRGEMSEPHTIAMDSRGRLFVGDRENNRIASARDGKVSAFIEDSESTAPDHAGAEGLGVDARGNVYGAVVRRQMLERHVKK